MMPSATANSGSVRVSSALYSPTRISTASL